MLLLTRRQGESIMIGDGIRVRVMTVSDATDEVQIQIDAPDFVAIPSGVTDSESSDRRAVPIITHKRRWRALLTG
jgi:carbon storage regulator